MTNECVDAALLTEFVQTFGQHKMSQHQVEVVFEYFGLPTANYPLPVEKIARSIRGDAALLSSLRSTSATRAPPSKSTIRFDDNRYLSSANLPAPILHKLRGGAKKGRVRSAAKKLATLADPTISRQSLNQVSLFSPLSEAQAQGRELRRARHSELAPARSIDSEPETR
jgi:hypothetical protein